MATVRREPVTTKTPGGSSPVTTKTPGGPEPVTWRVVEGAPDVYADSFDEYLYLYIQALFDATVSLHSGAFKVDVQPAFRRTDASGIERPTVLWTVESFDERPTFHGASLEAAVHFECCAPNYYDANELGRRLLKGLRPSRRVLQVGRIGEDNSPNQNLYVRVMDLTMDARGFSEG